MNASRKHQRGLTLVELSLSLAVSLAIGAAVAGLYVQSNQAAKYERTRQEVLQVVSAVTQMATTGPRADIDAEAVGASGLVADYMVDGTTLRHSLDGVITVAEDDIAGGNARAMSVLVEGLDAADCTEIASTLSDRFDVVVAGGTILRDETASPIVESGRLDAAAACEGGQDVAFFFVP